MASRHIKIDNREDFEDRIYVHAHRYNSFLSGWGVVIDSQGKRTELLGSSTEDANRLLLRATIAALESLHTGFPVTVLCPSNYLTTWVIGRMTELHTDDWKLARKKANFDLVKQLHALTRRLPYAFGQTVLPGIWPQQLTKADELARSCGSAECYDKAGWFVRRKEQASKHKAKRVASVSLETVNPADDVPWD